MDKVIEFNEELHSYKINGVNCQSVTQLMQDYGFGDVSHINPQIIADAAYLGTCVHETIQYHLEGRLDETTLDPILGQYLDSFKQFEKSCDLQVLVTEERVGDKNLGIAGTLDLRCEYNGELTIIDFKTSKQWFRHWYIQLEGYRYLSDIGVKPEHQTKHILPLRINADRFYLPPDNLRTGEELDAFLAMVTLKNYKGLK